MKSPRYLQPANSIDQTAALLNASSGDRGTDLDVDEELALGSIVEQEPMGNRRKDNLNAISRKKRSVSVEDVDDCEEDQQQSRPQGSDDGCRKRNRDSPHDIPIVEGDLIDMTPFLRFGEAHLAPTDHTVTEPSRHPVSELMEFVQGRNRGASGPNAWSLQEVWIVYDQSIPRYKLQISLLQGQTVQYTQVGDEAVNKRTAKHSASARLVASLNGEPNPYETFTQNSISFVGGNPAMAVKEWCDRHRCILAEDYTPGPPFCCTLSVVRPGSALGEERTSEPKPSKKEAKHAAAHLLWEALQNQL